MMKSEPLYFWFAGDVTAAILVVKSKSISPSLGSNLYFPVNSSRKQFFFTDPQHGRLVTWLQTKNTHMVT